MQIFASIQKKFRLLNFVLQDGFLINFILLFFSSLYKRILIFHLYPHTTTVLGHAQYLHKHHTTY